MLIIIYNRPQLTAQLFSLLKTIKPKLLYIAADGPKDKRDEILCDETRKIVNDSISWNCEVFRLYRDQNLGCGKSVSGSIDWFFDQEKMGIILEDDICPHPSFFDYCSEMLQLYEGDQRIMMISGLNVNGKWKNRKQSYHFSFHGGVWGWATWRRSWKLYDFEISQWSNKEIRDKIISNFFNSKQRKSRIDLYNKIARHEIDTWDIQWGFCRLINSGLSIIPSENLIKNLGISGNATHTKSDHPWADLSIGKFDKEKITHPKSVMSDLKYDYIHINSQSPEKHIGFMNSMKRIIKSLWH